MAKAPKKRVATSDTPSFDELLDQLRSVVSELEDGNLGLGESLEAFERGVALAKRGHSILDSAEKRVEVLLAPATDDSEERVEALEDDGE